MRQFVSAHGFINNEALEAGNLKNTKSADVKLEPVCNGQSMYGGVCESSTTVTIRC